MSKKTKKKIQAEYIEILYESGETDRIKMKPKYTVRAERQGLDLEGVETMFKMAFWGLRPQGTRQEFDLWLEDVDMIERVDLEAEDLEEDEGHGPLVEV